jgi:putative oxidoreductase
MRALSSYCPLHCIQLRVIIARDESSEGGRVSLGLLVLRVVLGVLFLGHASHKFFGASHPVLGFAGGMGPRKTAEYMESVGLKPGLPNVVLAGIAEVASGVLLIAGLLTPVAGALMIAVLTVALVVEHLPKGMWEGQGGIEYPLVLLAGLFALVCTGPGRWSVGHALDLQPAGWRWGVGALAVGLAGAASALVSGRLMRRRTAAVSELSGT